MTRTSRKRNESGAVALMFAMLAVAMMGIAALGVDFASQVNERQKLQDAMDAGAQAGAYQLPTDGAKSLADALAFSAAADDQATPDVDYYCVVGSLASGASWILDVSQIPGVCNPASAKVASTYTGLRCGSRICSIPCQPLLGDQCNTIRLVDSKNVPFTFARALGITQGGTGALSSVACKGSCGTIPPNPMDVAVVADRTGSMSSTDVSSMIAGIKAMLKVMTPTQQYVSLGSIGRASSSAPSSCKSSPSSSATTGPWIPTPFSTGYLNSAGTDVNTSSQLIKDISCLTTASSTGTSLAAPLKAAARYLLGSAVGATNNLTSLPTRNMGTPKKVLIFETDGQPNESAATGGSASLSTSSDLFSNSASYSTSTLTTGPVPNVVTTTTTTGVGSAKITINTNTTYNTTTTTTTNVYNGGQNACNNLKTVAANAKAAGILVITIAYNLSGVTCDQNNPNPPAPTSSTVDGPITVVSDVLVAKVRTINQTVNRTVTNVVWSAPVGNNVTGVLAEVASPTAGGVASSNNNDCGTTVGRTTENTDGDYFFCAASGTDMAPIFKSALSQVGSGIKLIRLP
ncbi:MAG: pilus assembly protein [Propionibacteriales bacterium]|nr:pilus assembly protein [Propionibacteriales bacterium]